MRKSENHSIVLSGMRPTGALHLGHYTGALENWVALQDVYTNYHLIADYHALTTNTDTSRIFENTIEMVIDWLAAGIDPARSPIFRQSQVKQHTELFLIFSMLVTKNRLERNPTLKEQVRDLGIESENLAYGHLGYPVLQASDILLYRAHAVPVGEDQLANIEITREIARRFNREYGEVFPEPKALLTEFKRLPGLDGIDRKMSKSLGNTILLSDTPETIAAKLRKAVTDPLKVRRNDPGRPDVCLVFTYHRRFNAGEIDEIRAGCTSGALGCVECKQRCAARIADALAPHREHRVPYEKDRSLVLDILAEGEKKARRRAATTMRAVHRAMRLGGRIGKTSVS
ncbi:MAG: tryptophan--tRNA ligase [Bacteroidota bacterium]|nr:tryptophan--tRNA ligase [Bacteroidota bacterium]